MLNFRTSKNFATVCGAAVLHRPMHCPPVGSLPSGRKCGSTKRGAGCPTMLRPPRRTDSQWPRGRATNPRICRRSHLCRQNKENHQPEKQPNLQTAPVSRKSAAATPGLGTRSAQYMRCGGGCCHCYASLIKFPLLISAEEANKQAQ